MVRLTAMLAAGTWCEGKLRHTMDKKHNVEGTLSVTRGSWRGLVLPLRTA